MGSPSGMFTAALRPMACVHFLVPLADNDGVAFSAEKFSALDAFLLRLSSGLTQGDGVLGKWALEGRIYADRLRSYYVMVPLNAGVETALAIEEYIKREFSQLAAYVTVTRHATTRL